MAEGDRSETGAGAGAGSGGRGEVYFYHMTRTPLEATLPLLLEKALAAGWKVLVRGRERAQLEWLDQKLWLGEGFLPHGLEGGAHDSDQPVLLSTAPANPHGAQALVAIDGAPVQPDEVAGFVRVMVLFDGSDPGALEVARAQWRALSGAGARALYWSQESGRWEKKAESGG